MGFQNIRNDPSNFHLQKNSVYQSWYGAILSSCAAHVWWHGQSGPLRDMNVELAETKLKLRHWWVTTFYSLMQM